VFLLAWLLLKMSYLLTMFISREREYRADAASVRMTRNPLALAEALHLLSRSWRGAGFIGSGFEMLCIVNPQAMALDETEGFWADLFSTHPPIRKRLDVLLKMARVSVAELDEKAVSRKTSLPGTSVPHYYAMSPQQRWDGPFTIAELGALPWLSPLTWVTTGDERPVDRAWKEPVINAVFAGRLSDRDRPISGYACPACRQPLVTESFEGTQINQCRFCSGILVESEKIPRIIARTGRERPCSERVNALAKAVVAGNQRSHARRKLSGGAPAPRPFISCPKCGNPMLRQFYSQAHLIEIDRCGLCGLTWFEQNELEMLQCIIASMAHEAPVTGEKPEHDYH
jgi:Zn-finger nucleic acid-binding protein